MEHFPPSAFHGEKKKIDLINLARRRTREAMSMAHNAELISSPPPPRALLGEDSIKPCVVERVEGGDRNYAILNDVLKH